MESGMDFTEAGLDYAKYIEAFNTGNDAELVERWFTEDCFFQSGARKIRGRKELLDFLNWAHDGIREIIRAKTVLTGENRIFAEIDMDFHATRDRPDFVFGPLKKGEFHTVKFFVLYHIRDGRVAHLKAAPWPANEGVSRPEPRLGSGLEARQAFRDYLAAFSGAEFDKFSAYYTDDVVCELRGRTLTGKAAIVDFYKSMFAKIREQLTPHQIVMDDHGIFMDATARFTGLVDASDFDSMPLKEGQSVEARVFVTYTLRDGKISSIKVARPAGSPQQN
jgi:ketosteroid isomerase-like protein